MFRVRCVVTDITSQFAIKVKLSQMLTVAVLRLLCPLFLQPCNAPDSESMDRGPMKGEKSYSVTARCVGHTAKS